MTKAEFVALLSEKTEQSQKAINEMLQAFTEIVTDALVRGESLLFPGLGTFDVKTRAARKGRNPRTGETIEIAEAIVPYFKAASLLKSTVNEETSKKTIKASKQK
jgi:DNA-binding protein HU-beta